jgi:peroxiredoxin
MMPGFESIEALETLYNQLQPAAKKGAYAAGIEKTITSTKLAQVGQIGSQALDFIQKDVDGKAVSLSSFKGKYVLVDFWASWCKPCRMENPNVVNAYNQYKNKNFTVLGVSLDQAKPNWLQAIQADNLTWTHVSDLQYWNNAVAQLYHIQSIPANMLIDPSGKIIARDLRGEDLNRTLSQLLK